MREQLPERLALHWLNELTSGLSHIKAEPALRRMMIAGAVAFLVIGINESVFFAVIDKGLHRPPEFMGVLASAQGVGAIAGGLLVARLIGRAGELAATAVGLAAFGLGDGLCVFPALPPVLAGKAVAGLGLSVTVVGLNTLVQRRTPGHLVGRVSMAAETLTGGPQTISIAGGAILVSMVSYRLLLTIVLTGMLIGAVYLWFGRRRTQPQRQAKPSTLVAAHCDSDHCEYGGPGGGWG